MVNIIFNWAGLNSKDGEVTVMRLRMYVFITCQKVYFLLHVHA